MLRVSEGANVRSVLRPVKEAGSGQAPGVRVECPYPLLTAGIARALEETRSRPRQNFDEAKVSEVVVLWAEEADSLSESVQRLQEESPDAPVVVLGLREELPLAWAALQAGARGFIHARMQPEQIARAISVAARGEIVAPRGLIEYLATGEYTGHAALRPRQQEILELVAEGMSNAEIARRLYLSESTIKQHLRAAYRVLGVSNRTEAAKLVRDSRGH